MGLLNKFLGFRWSLYVVKNGNQLAYAMHEHSALRMVGYVMGYFADGGKPVEPWSLLLNFNHKHQTIALRPEHFTRDGENVTSVLIQEIEAVDPGWEVKGGEPVFEEAATKNVSRSASTRLEASTFRRCWITSESRVNSPSTQ